MTARFDAFAMLRPARRLYGVLVASLLLAGCQTTTPTGFSAAQRSLLTANGFFETARGWELIMPDRLLFAINDSRLQPDQVSSIAKLAADLSRAGILTARVEGHTDATGSTEHNAQLSTDRARAVADPLRTNGMQLADSDVLGRGEAFPIGDNKTDEGRADNRRVVIIVTP
jgi:outer membrane protein OmpA-like peptidoglycan-associated protein